MKDCDVQRVSESTEGIIIFQLYFVYKTKAFETVEIGSKPLFRHGKSIFEEDSSRILNNTIVELILGDADTSKDGEAFRCDRTSFRLIWLKSKG